MNLRNILRKLKPEDIKLALQWGKLERRREQLQGKLDAVLVEMAKLEGDAPARRGPGRPRKVDAVAPAPVQRKRKRFSRQARLNMKAAAKLRWQKIKAAEPAQAASQ